MSKLLGVVLGLTMASLVGAGTLAAALAQRDGEPSPQEARQAQKTAVPPQPRAVPGEANLRAKAIQGAVQFLKRQQQDDGSWPEIDQRTPGGMTGFVTLALLEAGEPAEDDSMARALAILEKKTVEDLGKTYSVALQTMVFAQANPARYRQRLEENVRWLEAAQITAGDRVEWPGSWTYDPMKANQGDSSNTYFAILGLHAASEAGIAVNPETWKLARSYWEACQSKGPTDEGGWGYYPNNLQSVSGNLTCEGIASLAMCDRALGRMQVEDPENSKKATDQQIAAGLNWLENHFRIDANPGNLRMNELWRYSYLWSLKRMGRLLDLREIDGHDLYAEGVQELLATRQWDHIEGCWKGMGPETNPLVATSFALMFLADKVAR